MNRSICILTKKNLYEITLTTGDKYYDVTIATYNINIMWRYNKSYNISIIQYKNDKIPIVTP